MARRLFVVWVAIISLALLVQAAPGLATTYDLGSDPYGCTEMFPVSGGLEYTPGSVGSTFIGRQPWDTGTEWQIGDWSGEENKALKTKVAATQGDLGGGDYRFTYTYDDIEAGGQVRFKVTIPGVDITSYDATITITADYHKNTDTNWDYIANTGTIEGIGTDDATGMWFTFSGILVEEPNHNHTHYLHFVTYNDIEDKYENYFVLTYPASAVPIPGAVWLLGTGMLGLWCLGRRRKD